MSTGFQGKRSISDQMNEGVNYVKYLEKKIKELGVKRDELKRLSNLSISASQIETSDQNDTSPINRFVVHQSLVGIEIAYSCGYLEQELPLSKVLEVLLDEGLCVVNCVSTRVDERLLHTIQAEVTFHKHLLLYISVRVLCSMLSILGHVRFIYM